MRKARLPISDRCGSEARLTDRSAAAQGWAAGIGVPPPEPPPLGAVPPLGPSASVPLPVLLPLPSASLVAVGGEDGTGREVVGVAGGDAGTGAVPSARVSVGFGSEPVHPVSMSAADTSAIVVQGPRARTGSVC